MELMGLDYKTFVLYEKMYLAQEHGSHEVRFADKSESVGPDSTDRTPSRSANRRRRNRLTGNASRFGHTRRKARDMRATLAMAAELNAKRSHSATFREPDSQCFVNFTLGTKIDPLSRLIETK
jgi:hypothetical protein